MGTGLNVASQKALARRVDTPPRQHDVRSLLKGLNLLEVLNAHPGLCFREICEKTALSEGTAFRMLRTLLDLKLIKLDPHTRTYSVAQRVMTLSHGYDAEGWVSAIAWPRLKQLGQIIDWPVSLLTLSGAHVLVRATTDEFSHMVFGVSRAGAKLPILGSCSGATLLAHLNPVEQAARLALLETTTQRTLLATRSRAEWRAHFEAVKHNGWSGNVQPDTRQSFLSFPVKLNENDVLGVITIKYFTSAMKLEDAASRYGPAMRAAAQGISTGYQAWISDMDQGADNGHV